MIWYIIPPLIVGGLLGLYAGVARSSDRPSDEMATRAKTGAVLGAAIAVAAALLLRGSPLNPFEECKGEYVARVDRTAECIEP